MTVLLKVGGCHLCYTLFVSCQVEQHDQTLTITSELLEHELLKGSDFLSVKTLMGEVKDLHQKVTVVQEDLQHIFLLQAAKLELRKKVDENKASVRNKRTINTKVTASIMN